jgi:anti-sigma B factor antagonist
MDGKGASPLHDDATPRPATPAGDQPFTGEQAAASVRFAISRREVGGLHATSVVAVEGELDLASAPQLKRELADAVRAGSRRLIIDLSAVTFIDSTALGVLVSLQKNLHDDAHLAIVGAEGDVLQIFELTGLDATFEMFPSFEEGLAWMRGSAAPAG